MNNTIFKVQDISILKTRFGDKEYVSVYDIIDEMDSMQNEIDDLNDEIYRIEHQDEVAYDNYINEQIDEMILESKER